MFGFAKKLVSSIESQLTFDDSENGPRFDESRQGLRVLSVKPNSIGSNHGFESWFDFIVALNGTDICAYLEMNTETGHVGYSNMLNYIRHEVEVAKSDITFSVFSSKGSILRDIVISSAEILENISTNPPPLEEVNLSSDASDPTNQPPQWTPNLGLSFQLTPLSTGFFMWHVLRVHPGSPAYVAGITPDEYIIQAQDGLLATGGEDLLSKVLQSHYSKHGDGAEVVLYVYNYDSDCVRPVRVILKAGALWGGRGILGCDVGYGLLHRVPEVIGKFQSKSADQQLPGSVTSNTSTNTQDQVPSLTLTQPPQFLPLQHNVAPSFKSDGTGATAEEAARSVLNNPHRKRGHNLASRRPNVNLDAYFDEQTKMSQAADTGSTAKNSSTPVPPPPKKA